MLGFRFNQLFFGFMLLSFLSAFVVPPRFTDLGRAQFGGIFTPISRPAYRLSAWLRSRLDPAVSDDTRSSQTIEDENRGLREQILIQKAQIESLEIKAAERESLGSLDTLCDRFSVTGIDSDRDGLLIGGNGLGGIQKDQPVLYGNSIEGSVSIAGRIDRAGEASGAHVRLVTDLNFGLSGKFVRFVQQDNAVVAVTLSKSPFSVRGIGGQQMVITTLPMAEVEKAQIATGDWVVLDDSHWPMLVQGIRVGRVSTIEKLPEQPLFAKITLSREERLTQLNDVWVMTRQP
jgi:cell shape-determining protein MreC